jgi:L-amino acid N-acyltransferase YncA
MEIREASAADWPRIWPFMREIVAAGETLSWAVDTTEELARGWWFPPSPGRTIVAVADDGAIVGTAVSGPNRPGPGAHIATASFMVDPRRFGHGAGRALGQRVVDQARTDGFHGMQFNAVVDANTRAVKLWHSLGFQTVAIIPGAFKHPTQGYVGLHIMYQSFSSPAASVR